MALNETLKNIATFFLVILLFFSLLIFAFLMTIDMTILSPNTYKKAISGGIELKGPDTYDPNNKDYMALELNITKEQLNPLIDNIFRYIRSDTDELNLDIAVSGLKEDIREQALKRNITLKEEVLNGINDSISLLDITPDAKKDIDMLRVIVTQFRYTLIISVVIIFLITSFLMLMHREDKERLTRNLGRAFTAAGIIGLIGVGITLWTLSSFVSFPEAVFYHFFKSIISSIGTTAIIIHLIFLAIGILLLIGSRSMKKKTV
jgi:hypothetical protein